MYDVIVVGARCGGSPTAMLLARKGYRVLLVDRTSFPSDTMSSHYVHAYGVARLAHWGLLDRVLATGCPPVTVLTSDWGTLRLSGTPVPYEDIGFGLCPRRYIIDKILLDAAVEAGVEVEESFTVSGLLWDGDRVAGIRGRRSGGPEVEIRATYTVGADGMRSTVAREVQAPEYNTVPSLSVTYYTYFENLHLDELLIHRLPGRCVPAIPTNDGLTVVLCGWPYDEWREFRSDIEGNYFRTIEERTPAFAERVRAARRVERFAGTHEVPNFYRKPYGPGWALVGDAGYHKDPVSALGMSDAFRDVELLVDGLHDTLSGERPAEDALGDYERSRNAASQSLYGLTLDQAKFQPPTPQMMALFQALVDNEPDRNRFFGVLAGSVPAAEYFAPENIGRILMQAGIRPPEAAPSPAPATG